MKVEICYGDNNILTFIIYFCILCLTFTFGTLDFHKLFPRTYNLHSWYHHAFQHLFDPKNLLDLSDNPTLYLPMIPSICNYIDVYLCYCFKKYIYKHIFWWNTWNDILSAMPNSSGFWSSCAYLFFLLLIPLARTARYTLSSNSLCKKRLESFKNMHWQHNWVVYWLLQWNYLSCWIARFCRFLVAAFFASFSAFLCCTRASFAS